MAGEEKFEYISASVRGQKEKRRVVLVDVVGLSSCICGAEN